MDNNASTTNGGVLDSSREALVEMIAKQGVKRQRDPSASSNCAAGNGSGDASRRQCEKKSKKKKKKVQKRKSKKKRCRDGSSSSASSLDGDDSNSGKKKRFKKKRKKRSKHSTSSDSSTHKKASKKSKKKKSKKSKRSDSSSDSEDKHKILKKPKKQKDIEDKSIISKPAENVDAETSVGPAIPEGMKDPSRAMVPMTKEEWEKRQSVVRRVFDSDTGRHRLVKGDGEILEECVSRDRHLQINKQATAADGVYFQMNVPKK